MQTGPKKRKNENECLPVCPMKQASVARPGIFTQKTISTTGSAAEHLWEGTVL